jgi:AcrR family transcriptional regulator
MPETTVRLTRKGLATREHIVTTAAQLMHEQGAQGTSNDDVRKAAGVSGSQLSHYFRDKDSLVSAVIAWWADRAIAIGRNPPTLRLDSIAALRQWADFYIEREEICLAGCRFGSLASEAMKAGLDVQDEVSAGFSRWAAVFVDGLSAMRERGELSSAADARALAYVLLSAFEGGMLLTRAEGGVAPLRASLNGAIDYVSSFLVHPTEEKS